MTKDQAAKFNGSWKQVKAENMDAVSDPTSLRVIVYDSLFMTHIQVLAATGMGWTVRKVAGMMDVFLDIEAKDEGLFTSLKTKLKNTDNLLLYSGVTKTKGLSDDEVRSLIYYTLHHTGVVEYAQTI